MSEVSVTVACQVESMFKFVLQCFIKGSILCSFSVELLDLYVITGAPNLKIKKEIKK